MLIQGVLRIALWQLGDQNLVRSEVLAPAVHVGDVVALWVDGDVIRIDAQVVAHFLTDIFFVIAVFLEHQLVAHTVTTAVFHHVAARMFKVHAVHGDVPEVGKYLRHVVIVGTGTIVAVIYNGGGTVFENVPRAIVANPIRIGGGVDKGDVVHVDTCVLEAALCTALLLGDAINVAIVGQINNKAGRDTQRVTDHDALHWLELAHEAWCTRRWIRLNEIFVADRGVHLFLGEVVPAFPIWSSFLCLNSCNSHQGDKSENSNKSFHDIRS